jgi:hypothetical protein
MSAGAFYLSTLQSKWRTCFGTLESLQFVESCVSRSSRSFTSKKCSPNLFLASDNLLIVLQACCCARSKRALAAEIPLPFILFSSSLNVCHCFAPHSLKSSQYCAQALCNILHCKTQCTSTLLVYVASCTHMGSKWLLINHPPAACSVCSN